MTGFKPLYVSPTGIAKYWRDNGDGTSSVLSVQDVGAILEQNKAMATHNDGYTPSRDIRRAASVPVTLIMKWFVEEGWWFYDMDKDPGVARKVAQKLNSNEFEHLRTAPGRLGVSGGELR